MTTLVTGHAILAVVVGSRAYGHDGPGSDHDRRGADHRTARAAVDTLLYAVRERGLR